MSDKDLSEAELRDLLKPRRRPPQPVVKGRQCVLSQRDIRAFVNMVRERFPAVVFLTGERVGEWRTKWELVPDPVGADDDIYAVVPDGDWDVEAYCAASSQPSGNLPEKTFSFWLSSKSVFHKHDSGRTIECLSQGMVRGGHARSDRETARFLAQVWRLTTKVSTNKLDVIAIEEESGRVIGPRRIPFIWFGFDALRWCQEKENRVLEWRYRPPDDWEMPDLPYYD